MTKKKLIATGRHKLLPIEAKMLQRVSDDGYAADASLKVAVQCHAQSIKEIRDLSRNTWGDILDRLGLDTNMEWVTRSDFDEIYIEVKEKDE